MLKVIQLKLHLESSGWEKDLSDGDAKKAEMAEQWRGILQEPVPCSVLQGKRFGVPHLISMCLSIQVLINPL